MKNYFAQVNMQPVVKASGGVIGSTIRNQKNSFNQLLRDNLESKQISDRQEMNQNKYSVLLQNKKDISISSNQKQTASRNSDMEVVVQEKDGSNAAKERVSELLAMLLNLKEALVTVPEENIELPVALSSLEILKTSLEQLQKPASEAGVSLEDIIKDMEQVLNSLSKETTSSIGQNDMNITQEEEINIDANAKKLLKELQHIINRLSERLQDQPEEVKTVDMAPLEKKEMIKASVKKLEIKNVELDQETIEPVKDKVLVNQREVVETKKEDKGRNEHQRPTQLEDVHITKINPQHKDLNVMIGSSVEKLAEVSQEPTNAMPSALPKPSFPNIMEQILPKAEVFIDDERSEMLIQLKPDHLGKLVMKLEVEKGIVVAKFLAESHIVKEILESNMNTLKDSLQQKGLNVQELSVFVGNDGNFQKQQHFMAFQKRQNNSKIKGLGSFHGAAAVQAEAQTVKSLHSENIDFLA
ncbi:Flagellar hook-length control protein FliK [Geosporobacter subterraneus DSM 17957]|uniref:Flagellar hook-length control protein FliK n=1 Tax=Geosporobacter subterraneus DSM 17957 TaxID=1121919 RepID=A0A1M6E4B4_9FIRM|nr:flagellar hook-length control protein FliK [Geosporobacter subterraneus]SHI80342.1 Flagellar hook-length control protein FliK [Geosporobacter subterraneus DSM 17957]